MLLLQAVRIRAPITRMRTGTQVRQEAGRRPPSVLAVRAASRQVSGSEFRFRVSSVESWLGHCSLSCSTAAGPWVQLQL